MSAIETAVTMVDALLAGAENGAERIIIGGRLTDAPCIPLSPRRSLRGNDDSALIAFQAGVDGVQFSTDTNSVCNLDLLRVSRNACYLQRYCRADRGPTRITHWRLS